MATQDATNTKPFKTFLNLDGPEQMAIVLKSEGRMYEEIIADINREFGRQYSLQTLKWWFMAGGKLEQAYLDYLEELGNEAVREAKLLIRRGTRAAASTLIQKLTSKDERVQVRAATGLLNKYVPDKQITIIEDGVGDDDLPEELSDKADSIVTGGQDGGDEPRAVEPSAGDGEPANSDSGTASEAGSGDSKPLDGPEHSGSEPVDDAPKGETDQESAGDGGSESVPEELLQEREATDTAGDTPT